MNDGDPVPKVEIQDLLHVFKLLDLSSLFQMCALASTALCVQGFFTRHLAISDGFRLCLIQQPPKIAIRELWTVAATRVSQQSLH